MKKKHFSPHLSPFKPRPPQKNVPGKEIELGTETGNYYHHSIPEGADSVYIEAEEGINGRISTLIKFYKTVPEVVNPDYDRQYKKYEADLAKYKVELKEWKVLKKEYDEETARKKEEWERAQLAKLKEKYEKNDSERSA